MVWRRGHLTNIIFLFQCDAIYAKVHCLYRRTIHPSTSHSFPKPLLFFINQGIIAGPEEFAEGVARGVKSLLGHVIGKLSLRLLVFNSKYSIFISRRLRIICFFKERLPD